MILHVWWRGLNTQPKIMTLNREQPAGGGREGGVKSGATTPPPQEGQEGVRST